MKVSGYGNYNYIQKNTEIFTKQTPDMRQTKLKP